MKKRDLRKEPLWRLAIRFGAVFIIIVIIIQLLWEFFSSGNLKVVTDSFKNGQWFTYVIFKLLLGLVYGFTMAYFTKRKAQKRR